MHARSVAKGGGGGGGGGGGRALPPPTFLRVRPYFVFDTRLAESAVARLAISMRIAII